MRRFKHLLWLSALSLVSLQAVLASTVQVGTCKPHLKSFSTISAAVSGVAAGSTIQVCPGTYAEQVTITQPLNLEGATVGTGNDVVIAVPTAGLLPNTTSMFGESVAAQILVEGAGPVHITNIAVDGTGGDMGCSSGIWVVGIFYGSGSSGTVARVRASGQVDGTCGVGIWAENSLSTMESVTIRDSIVYNVDSVGIFAGSGATPSLSVTLDNNVVSASAAVADIDTDSVSASVIGNDLADSSFGIFDISGSSITSNRVVGASNGIYLGFGGTASGNHVSGASDGILLAASGATLTNNRIMSSTTAGLELGCFTATVSGNLINDAPIGVDAAAGTLGSNTVANTATTVTNGCAVAAVAAIRGLTTYSMTTVVRKRADVSEWHTPATPFGTRTD